MTRSLSGHLPPQSTLPSAQRWKQFAALPDYAPEVLVRDTICLDRPSKIWSQNSIERRRRFQTLVNRYYRQLLYGCTNTECQTPTCLSCRKRLARGPFRRFTVLSARTLACFLASQDDPEKGLCPHESVAVAEVQISRRDLKRSHHSRKKVALEKGDDPSRGQNDLARMRVGISDEGHSVEQFVNPRFIAQPKDGSEDRREKPVRHNKLPKDKDPKSFTQNLFDTTPMKLLQAYIPNQYLQWCPWANRIKAPSADSDNHQTRQNVVIPREQNGIGNSTESHGLCATQPEFIAAQALQPAISTTKRHTTMCWSASANQQHKRGMRTSVSGVMERRRPLHNGGEAVTLPWKSSKRTADTENGKQPTYRRGNRSLGTREGLYHSESDGELEVARIAPSLKERKRAVSGTGVEAPNRLQEQSPSGGGLREVRQGREYSASAQDDVLAQNVFSSPERPAYKPFEKAETLSCLTAENIDALVEMIKAADTSLCDGRLMLRAIGRTDSSYLQPATFDCGSSMEVQKTLAFGVQTLNYVLADTAALLKSFLCCPSCEILPNTEETRCTINSEELLRQFRKLMEIDHHPRTILPSLWIATGVLFNAPLAYAHPKCSILSAGTALLDSRQKYSADIIQYGFHKEISLGDADSTHIAKIVLAALVATVPKSNPETWLAVQKLRASGHVAPEVHVKIWNFHIVRSLLETMDAFEDEAALALMTRLVRAISARRCMSEMAKNKRSGRRHRNAPADAQHDMLSSILEFFTQNKAIETQSAHANTATGNSQKSWQGGVNNHYQEDSKKTLTARWSFPAVTVEWLRSVLLKEWNGKVEVAKWGAVGGAIEMMSTFYEHYAELGLQPETFHTPFLSERLDPMDMPLEWLNSHPKTNTIHLLSYPFLFPPSALVTYFRAINHSAMFKAFEASITTTRMVMQMTFAESALADHRESRLFERLTVAMTNYLVLEIRRDNVLTCALNQLWRREKRELMRPLKVRMGMEEGEEGVDHGGVQQEFFRMAIGEALNPNYGLFTTDNRTRMSWFQPCSLEPLHKFELLGLLTSLAIYNGLTLPITFPLTLYRKLLGMPVRSLDHIRDGWPELAKGLTGLLTWADGNVEDVFMRSYVFSAEALGSTLFVDMERIGRDDAWPPVKTDKGKRNTRSTSFEAEQGISDASTANDQARGSPGSSINGSDGWITLERPAISVDDLLDPKGGSTSGESSYPILRPRTNSVTSQASMVTNENREQYVMDYIFWLTDKSVRPQYEAFERGFFVCLDRKALSIFTPDALQSVVEGIQEIDVDALEQTARYENGYHADHRIIKEFWHVVRQFSPEKVRQLLEFVTASDRIPVNGIRSILFVIQRNGTSDDRVPTSLTCFGRLLLPEYSSRKKLKEKLRLAIENSKGFGVA